MKKYFLLSVLVLILGFGYTSSIYKFSEKKIIQQNDISIMSYNVRMFNHYEWNPIDSIGKKTNSFINDLRPDILAIQEFYDGEDINLKYPHRYIKTKSKNNKFGLAIYSAFPIVNSGSLDLENTSNNIIFSDIVKGSDTIRIYNIHLESLSINPDKENFGQENSDKLMKRLKVAFQKQGFQIEKFLTHQQNWKGKNIVCGDFNNTAFSWAYKKIAEDRQDAFKIAGKGTGSSFNYSFPLRIDFILPDMNFKVNHFKTYDIEYSDHYPILARVELSSN